MASSSASLTAIAYVNSNVFAINATHPRVEVFVVGSDGQFGAVGTAAQVSATAKAQGIAIHDLEGKSVMPGLHDEHVHMPLSGIVLTGHARLPAQGLTADNVAEGLQQGRCLCKYAHVHEDWVVGEGYCVEDYKKEALDAGFPDTTVMIRGGAGHSAFLNSEAMRQSGYKPNEADG